MPTVHLSLPSNVYAELKEKAAEYGIQVTDLIKMFIKHGLELGITGMGKSREYQGEVEELKKKVVELEKQNMQLKKQVFSLRGRLRELEELVEYMIRRIDTLEEQIVGNIDINIVNEE